MKPLLLIPPVIALAIAGTVLLSQRNSISTLEEETALLRTRIASARGTPAGSDASAGTRANQPSAEKKVIDWKEIAAEFTDMQRNGGISDMRKMMAFQRRLQRMSAEEIVSALEEIQALEIGDEERQMLEMMLFGPLSEKDPELGLTRFSGRLKDEQSGASWQLANALGQWAKKDLTAATAWFDKEIAAGTFESKSLDGKSRILNQFESQLISQMLSSDFEKATERLASIPVDQRSEILGGYSFQNQKTEEDVAYARLVRSSLKPEEQLDVLSQRAANQAREGDFKKVDEYMDRIEATPEERVASANKAAEGFVQSKGWQGKLTTTDVDEMREWLGTQAPDAVDKVTGESIGSASRNGEQMKFSEASAMAVKYYESSGNDDVLVGFLDKSSTWDNKDEARELAGKISDPAKREEALKKLK